MTTIALPRTRTFQRARPMRLWWLATGLALLVNLAVVIGLSQVSRLHVAVAEPPLAVRSLRHTAPEAPPPPPPVVQQTAMAPAAAAAVVALPMLELPVTAPSDALALPALGSLDADLRLPLNMPAFAVIGASPLPPSPAGGVAFDTPAEPDGAFDLDRFYPRTARQRGLAGSSRLRLAIGADGRVSGVELLASNPPGVFDSAAERLARTLRFRPATRAGQPVATVMEQTIAWNIR